MLTASQLFSLAQSIETAGFVEVTQPDREQMAVALFFQGYAAGRACQIAFVELEDNDGALQMLARHRIAATQQDQTS